MSYEKIELLDLPVEINDYILLTLPLQSLLKACQTSIYFRDICNDDKFWRDKTSIDYDQITAYDKPQNLNWKEYYIKLYNSKIVPMYLFKNLDIPFQQAQFKGNIRIFKDEPIDDFIEKIYNMGEDYSKNFVTIENAHGESLNNTHNIDDISYIKLSPESPIYRKLHYDADFDVDEYNLMTFDEFD